MLERLDVDTDGRAFVAKSVLNALRRDAVQRLTDMRTQVRKQRTASYAPPTLSLQDDAGRIFPILSTHRCENRLFEGRPAKKDVRPLIDLGVRHFRVELMDEDAAESRRIVGRYCRMLEGGA